MSIYVKVIDEEKEEMKKKQQYIKQGKFIQFNNKPIISANNLVI